MKQSKGEGEMLGAGAEEGQEVAARDGDSLALRQIVTKAQHLRQIVTKAQHLRVIVTKAQQLLYSGTKRGS